MNRGYGTVVAAISEQSAALETSTQVLVVEVGGRHCAFLADVVVELHRMVAVDPLPGAPVVIDGVINVRGAVVPVIDLRARFGLAGHPPTPNDHLVIARANGRTVALRADRVLDLVELPPAVVASARGLPPGPHLHGVALLDDGVLLIHDVEAFLADHEVAALDDALAAHERPAAGP